MDAIDALTTRRSAAQFAEPAPDDETLAKILGAAMRAPDHGKLKPWRFIVLRGDARKRFGDVMVEAMKRREGRSNEAARARCAGEYARARAREAAACAAHRRSRRRDQGRPQDPGRR